MYSEGRQCAYTVDAATMRKQGKKQAEEEKKACSVADPDPFGPELICQIRIQINNYSSIRIRTLVQNIV